MKNPLDRENLAPFAKPIPHGSSAYKLLFPAHFHPNATCQLATRLLLDDVFALSENNCRGKHRVRDRYFS